MDYEGGGSSIELWRAEHEDPGLDSELRDRVHEELRWEPGLDASGIAVEVHDRAVTLLGSVRTYPEKVAAERAAARVPRAQQLTNRLSIELSPLHVRTDETILEEATRVLGWDALVPAGGVRAMVSDGCVTLEGQVDWYHERRAAEQAVEQLIGVQGVDNRITVRQKWMTGELQSEVAAALRHHPELHTRHVRIETRSSVVVLRGHVPSIAEVRAIEQTVRDVPGVVDLADELTIER